MKPLARFRSSPFEKCLFAAFFSILRLRIFQLVFVAMLPTVSAIPSSWSVREAAGVDGFPNTPTSTEPLAASASTSSPSASSQSGSENSSMSDTQLAIMLSIIASVIFAVAAILFFRRWWKKRRERSRNQGKYEDMEPLSASFQPGELPTLPYLPDSAAMRAPGLA